VVTLTSPPLLRATTPGGHRSLAGLNVGSKGQKCTDGVTRRRFYDSVSITKIYFDRPAGCRAFRWNEDGALAASEQVAGWHL